MAEHLLREGGNEGKLLLRDISKMFAHEMVDTFEFIGGRDSAAQIIVGALRQMAALRYVDSMANAKYLQAEQYALALAKMPPDYRGTIRKEREERIQSELFEASLPADTRQIA